MTTNHYDDVTQATRTKDATSCASRGFEFYFACAVVVISVIGTVANGVILYALVASKQHTKRFLIFNQNALDGFSCLCLLITYSLKICKIPLTGLSGYWLCKLILNENILWIGISGSRISLAAVTIERYLKVVHHKWSKKWLRNGVIYSVGAFLWTAGFVYCMALTIPTSIIVGGVCYAFAYWDSRTAQLAYVFFHFLIFYAIPLVITIYCYGHILVVIRRQARVMAAHNHASTSNTAQNQTHRKIQMNVIKTMFIVCAFYALFNLPLEVFFLVMNFKYNVILDNFSHYCTMFVMFLSITMNPFIYATKFDPVKLVLLGLLPCAKRRDISVRSTNVDLKQSASATNSRRPN